MMSSSQDPVHASSRTSGISPVDDDSVWTSSKISAFRDETHRLVTIGEHRHDQHELVAVLAGTLTCESVHGSSTISPGTAIWMPAGVPHSVTISTGTVFYGAYLSASSWLTAQANSTVAEQRWLLPHALTIAGGLGPLLDRLRHEDLDPARHHRTALVVVDLIMESAVSGDSLAVPQDVRAREVAEAILADPSDQREMRDWASDLDVSTKTLARAFQADTGMSFTSWRSRARIGQALSLLAAGQSVGAVAREVGYRNTSAFIVAFRAQVGSNPGAYARAHSAVSPGSL